MVVKSQREREDELAVTLAEALMHAGFRIGQEFGDRRGEIGPTNKLWYTSERGYVYSITIKGEGWTRPEGK